MSVAVCLLLYSVAVVVLGPGLLVRLTRAGVAPRLGVAAWLVGIGSVVAAWAAGAAFLAAELARDWTRPGGAVASACFAMLQQAALGRYGMLVQLGPLALAMLAATALVVLTWRLSRCLVRTRTSTHQHARMARTAGRHLDGLPAVVLDAPERLAYCVAGRPHTIVLTSAALDALDDPHLDAVLSHERAHLAGRHHLILAASRGLAATLPRIDLFTTAAAEITRLLEMCADDAAARTHGSRTVLAALLALSGTAPTPSGALGATGVEVLARAQRLAAPPPPAERMRARLALTATSILLAAGPLLTGTLAATGLALCSPMTGFPMTG